jgi:hypothetical protein
VIDAERIFSYRVLRIARKDKTPLASFDENSYAENSLAVKEVLLHQRRISCSKKSNGSVACFASEEQLSATGYFK